MIIDTSGFETFQMFMFGYVGLIVVLSVWKHIEDILGQWKRKLTRQSRMRALNVVTVTMHN